jgi:hypothetical protein
MNIRFTSSLTPDDENALAPALIDALSRILDVMPIAYMLRIDTSDSKVYQHSGPPPGSRFAGALPDRAEAAPEAAPHGRA